MKSLSGLDATFLYLETPEMPMHVGSMNVYELPEDFKGSFHQAVREHIARRMHLSPIFTRKLAFMPFDLGHPIWVEADDVDLDYHIRKVPGSNITIKLMEATCAKLHSRLLDREHPLWEFHIFDSLKSPDGKRLAGFYAKVHHAGLDGKGGTVLANAMLDLTPVPRQVPPADPARKGRTRGDLKVGEMIGAALSNTMAQYVKIARSLPQAASSLREAVAGQSFSKEGATGLARLTPKSPVSLAPKTLFNAAITTQRNFATVSLPFAECKAMGKAVGGSFNDVVLWLCSTALRSYLDAHDHIPKKPLVAAMPVSLREESNKEMNNQASASLVDLATHIANPQKRMQAIMASTAKVKAALASLKGVLPTNYPGLLAPLWVGGVARMATSTMKIGGVVERLPAFANVAISNVPGPQVPLYLAGAQMKTYYPVSIVSHGLALNITIQTYAGSVDFGLIADKKAVPALHELADALKEAFEQGRALFAAQAEAAKTVAPSVVTPKASVKKVTKVTQSKAAPSKVSAKKPPAAKKAATVKPKTTTAKKKAASKAA
jgi:WS/DGAT/MGAT family acyltransferase